MKILLIILLLFGTNVYGESEPVVAPSEPEQQEQQEQQKEVKGEPASAAKAPAPQAGQLRNRTLSEAFRTFRPSEEISADNAVPFPVDI